MSAGAEVDGLRIYVQARHRFPSELQKNIAAVATLAEAAAAPGP